jgi:hypothetical protein
MSVPCGDLRCIFGDHLGPRSCGCLKGLSPIQRVLVERWVNDAQERLRAAKAQPEIQPDKVQTQQPEVEVQTQPEVEVQTQPEVELKVTDVTTETPKFRRRRVREEDI